MIASSEYLLDFLHRRKD